ncbi:MAG: hydroxymethylbilane synthase [Phascolarctobacterium sp.]|nr:hydroxymethylbilane synthase [Phascolarctobacterium sp.]
MKEKLIIGTRKSLLALWQSRHIAERLKKEYPSCEVVLKEIVTKGDKIQDVPLAQIGGKGLFTKEIEEELTEGTIDLAVHSLKDMPTVLPRCLCLTAITERVASGDAFVSNNYESFAALPSGAPLGTSSLRRKAQLLAARGDLNIVDLRGNVDTRLRKLDEGKMDAVILAAAGLMRLGYAGRIREILPADICMPAVGQGALAIECRIDRRDIRDMLAFLNHKGTKQCTDAERAFLRLIAGSCQVPIGVHAEIEAGRMEIRAIIASLDGKKAVRDSIEGNPLAAESLGRVLSERMVAAGGQEILLKIL